MDSALLSGSDYLVEKIALKVKRYFSKSKGQSKETYRRTVTN